MDAGSGEVIGVVDRVWRARYGVVALPGSDPGSSPRSLVAGAEDPTASGQLTADDVDGDDVTFTLTSPATGTYGSLVLLASL